MSRDISEFYNERLSAWNLARWSFETTDDAIRTAAIIFAPILDKAIFDSCDTSVVYMYDELSDNESSVMIDGLPDSYNTSDKESFSYEKSVRKILNDVNWESVIAYIQTHINAFKFIMDPDVVERLFYKHALIKKMDSMREKYQIHIDDSISLKRSELKEILVTKCNLSKNHWLYRAINTWWNGTIYDILNSPVVSFAPMDDYVIDNLLDVSEVILKFESMYSRKNGSVIVRVLNDVKYYDGLMLFCLYTIDALYETQGTYINIFTKLDEILEQKGISLNIRYRILSDLFWICSKGYLRGLIPKTDDIKAVVTTFKDLSIDGSKMILDYPF